ncbi:MAG: bifunctional 2-C-methyl-D-erythritol 4-phosphate cytidylyltransferase/2-C-methyl-D-erythritol 2,4-cyclodiphosphate synthase [Mycoplasmataceae bacterium]|jgi:2-C-methyl-D-erythritol 4-phosphate cytidylyltransferase/2-C-methyl-D-erythritol 2,4-cyclodiphosphate synthase|nr:bifunctional 2-C-methyl-D-erythritol 4-phosphate cytidylyltransferase/2-C-methyl-D-erythritol 2,4-cyclodiphosphate synthase [Mycoplasmataceae bacterium]
MSFTSINGFKSCVALIVAAGRGRRFNSKIPKQWCDLRGRSLLRYSLGIFISHRAVNAVRVVINKDDRELYEIAASGLNLEEPILGGSTRQDSVRLGLEELTTIKPEIVLIHDGVRPFVDSDIIDRVIAGIENHDGAIPAVHICDTIKRVNSNGFVEETVLQKDLWRAQTPQGFCFSKLLLAHRLAIGKNCSDDAMVAEQANMNIAIVEGSQDNIKITNASDLRNANIRFTKSDDIRVSGGFDVHRFADGDHVTLCNTIIPHNASLEGHSDADVAFHALCDSLLGCISAGDIGCHFPDTDPRWKNANSEIFLTHAGSLIDSLGGKILHIDITIICQYPKIDCYRNTMIKRTAEILKIEESRISIKATTTEGLGFTGRSEGIATQTITTIRMPC